MKKYLVVALFALAVLVPSVSFAENDSSVKGTDDVIAGLQKQVAELLAKIERLKAEKSVPAFCYGFNRDITVGGRGDDVNALRRALKSSGIEAGADGEFDEDLAALVVKFQGKHGIRQTGYVGPLTRAKLNKLYSCDASVRAAVTKEIKAKDEKEAKSIIKKEATSVPVILKIGESGVLVAGNKNYVSGSSFGKISAAALVSVSTGARTELDIIARDGDHLKLMIPSLAAGEYTLFLTNELGTGSMKVELKTVQ